MRQTALQSGSLMTAPCFSSCVAKPPSITAQPPALCKKSSNNVVAFLIPISSFRPSRWFLVALKIDKQITGRNIGRRKWRTKSKINMKNCGSVFEHGRVFYSDSQVMRAPIPPFLQPLGVGGELKTQVHFHSFTFGLKPIHFPIFLFLPLPTIFLFSSFPLFLFSYSHFITLFSYNIPYQRKRSSYQFTPTKMKDALQDMGFGGKMIVAIFHFSDHLAFA